MVLIDKATPPLSDVAKLGSNPLLIYTLLFEAAQHDVRGDCGGTSCWSIKGLASELKITRKTVSRAISILLDCGYIQISGEERNKGGSNNTVWRVTHPGMLQSIRYAIAVMGQLPSDRLKVMRTKSKQANPYMPDIYT